jgi:hypothetical protein
MSDLMKTSDKVDIMVKGRLNHLEAMTQLCSLCFLGV